MARMAFDSKKIKMDFFQRKKNRRVGVSSFFFLHSRSIEVENDRLYVPNRVACEETVRNCIIVSRYRRRTQTKLAATALFLILFYRPLSYFTVHLCLSLSHVI